MRDVSIKSLCEPRIREHTRREPRTGFIYFGGDRENCREIIEGRVLYELTTPYGGVRRYAQDLAAVLPRKYMYRVRLAHKCVSLIHVNVADRLDIDVDRLHKRTCAHVGQKRMFEVRAYERRVRESVRARQTGVRQQRPGPELPTRRVLMVNLCGVGRRVHLEVGRRRMGGEVVLGVKVAGQAPDLLFPEFVVKDEISVVVFAVGIGADVWLQPIISASRRIQWVGAMRKLSHQGKTPQDGAGKEVAHGEPAEHMGCDA